jgi:hypothetical protein
MNQQGTRILYCHCAYSRVVPPEVKNEVLAKLAESGEPFDAVPDLCEMSARRDPELTELARCGSIRIAACYPRAVKWLFSAADAPLPQDATRILNMREQSADAVFEGLFGAGS